MPLIEDSLQQRFPQWFRGRHAAIARPLLRGAVQWSRLGDIERFMAAHAHLRGLAFVEATLAYLGADYAIDDADLARIPGRGGVVVVANHPSGALDALALLAAVGRVRGDVRIVANDLLAAVEPLGELLLAVRVFGGRADPRSLQAIDAALADGACVIVFPAGEVSRLSLRGVRDGRWRRGFLHYARRHGVPVLPVRVEARNSALFYGASAVFKPAATALLAREMFARRRHPVRLRTGVPMPVPSDGDAGRQLRDVRRALYALGRHVRTDRGPAPLIPAVPVRRLLVEIAKTELLGRTGDGKEIRLAQCAADAPLLQEIGRLRELTFRKVGEGTGSACDLDAFDAGYQHIVVWDASAQRIAGAYRVARGAPMLARAGLAGLYTASLFRYADEAVPRLAEGMELGRSFVVPDYWGSRSLEYLWQGIGAYLRRHPQVRYLFGAVSISAALPAPARDQIVAYYRAFHGGGQPGIAESRQPFRYFAAPPDFGALDADRAFDVLKANLAALGASVPMLYRQYTGLCDPGGARFLAFGVDPGFSDSIDGLVEVDLQRLRPEKRARYLSPRPSGVPA